MIQFTKRFGFLQVLAFTIALCSSSSYLFSQCNLSVDGGSQRFISPGSDSRLWIKVHKVSSLRGVCSQTISGSSATSWIQLRKDNETNQFAVFEISATSENTTSSDRSGTINFAVNGQSSSVTVVQPAFEIREDSNRNYTQVKSYDILGKLTGASRTYFDDLGKPLQSQTLDVSTYDVWTSETKYDSQGRPNIQTFPAPVDNKITYKSNFYSLHQGKVNPSTPLGRYYSQESEEGKDYTDQPISHSFYDDLNPGKILKVEAGNPIDVNGDGKAEEYPQGFSHTMQAAQELYYAFGKEYPLGYAFYNNVGGNILINNKIQKTVAIDPHGEEVVSFAYDDGTILATARSGEGPKKKVMSLIGEQGWVDIHLPKRCESSISFIGGASPYRCYNLKTGKEIFTPNLAPGMYRISLRDNTKPTGSTFIDGQGKIKAVSGTGAKGVTYDINYYDYSLNYYDDAGNLTSSLQPLGFDNEAYENYNLVGQVSHIKENLKSHFKYNSLNQLIYTSSPDEGEAWFKYRNDGQIRYSQNSKQVLEGKFSYTNYDSRARPIESGVIKNNEFVTLKGEDSNPSGTKEEQHFTLYDTPDAALSAIIEGYGRDFRYQNQAFVSGNVSKTYTNDANNTEATWYSYDIYGRVTWIVQQIHGLNGVKTIDYEYDEITGVVNKVYYQKDILGEEFVHRYTYDTEDYSLIKVETSIDDISFTEHAKYKYYETGELRRLELAKDLQGIDYIYNINGVLKAINHPDLSSSKDPGQDGELGSENAGFNKDIFGMQIDYYKGDYLRQGNHIATLNEGKDQYNGNIKAIRWNNKGADNTAIHQQKTYIYDYNRNNWLKEANFGHTNSNPENNHPEKVLINADRIWSAIGLDGEDEPPLKVPNGKHYTEVAQKEIVIPKGFHAEEGSTVHLRIEASGAGFTQSDDYKISNLTYDANGNIQSLKRNKNTEGESNKMDDLVYNYDSQKPNQLLQVEDSVTEETQADDIKHQTSSNNYEYNVIGQLVKNNAENIEYIYNTSGLVTEVKQNGSVRVKFYYNDRGQRVRKESYNPTTSTIDYTEHYVRDAAGTPMAIYRNNNLEEHTVYGASRLGIYKKNTGKTSYEITDHLGNVRVVISKAEPDNYFGTDYYPFGMPMPSRHSAGNQYRYAFQGQEKDSETGKEAFELRLWDARIGRWLTTDPYGEFFSPYLGMGNNPVSTIDIDGGCTDCTACPDACLKLNINQVPTGQGISYDFDNDSFSLVKESQANLLNTAIIGDLTVSEFVGVNTSDIQFLYPANANPKLAIDWNKKNEALQGTMMVLETMNVLFTGTLMFNNTTAPRQYVGSNVAPSSNTANQTTVVSRGVTNSGDARVVLQRGTRTYDITAQRVKEYVKNHRNPNARYGDAVNFKKYGVPDGSKIIKGAGKGHKRTPTPGELKILNGG